MFSHRLQAQRTAGKELLWQLGVGG